MIDEPLPLIRPAGYAPDSEDAVVIPAWYGYAFLAATWVLFIVSVNSLFLCWSLIIRPLKGTNIELHRTLTLVFETVDRYVISLWCIYVMYWWWACMSWLGLKIFRQSKGTNT